MQEPWATVSAIAILVVVLTAVVFVIREIFRLPGYIAGFFGNHAAARRRHDHEQALEAGFTAEEIDEVDRKNDASSAAAWSVIKFAFSIGAMILVTIFQFTVLGPIGIITVLASWLAYLKWAAPKLRGEQS
jgi:hypothetical protein